MEIVTEKKEYTSIESALNGDFDFSCHFIILFNNDLCLSANQTICQMNIFGKTIKEWVKSCAGGKYRTTEIMYSNSDNITERIRPFLTEDKYTVVLYADTPLLRFASIMALIDDFNVKGQNVKKLKRGYIFNTEFIKNAQSIYAPSMPTEFDDEFFTVVDTPSYIHAQNVIKMRIIAYHIGNNVIITNEENVYIDADVEIEGGAVLYGANTIFGNSYISKGAVLYPNNVIIDSYIGKNCTLKGCFLQNAKVKDDSIIEPFTKIVL